MTEIILDNVMEVVIGLLSLALTYLGYGRVQDNKTQKEIQEYSDYESEKVTLSERAKKALTRTDGTPPPPAYKRNAGMAIITGFTNSQINGKMPEEQSPITKMRVGEKASVGVKVTDDGNFFIGVFVDGKPAHNNDDNEYLIGFNNLPTDSDGDEQLLIIPQLTKTMKGLGLHTVQFKVAGNDGRYGVHTLPSEVTAWDWISVPYQVNLIQN